MRKSLFLIALASLFVVVLAAPGTPPAEAPDTAPRIGVFDSRGVALAYGRSARDDGMLAKVADIRRAHDEAAARGDTEEMQKLEGEAVAMQAEIHRQVFSGGPIDDILAMIKRDLPEIAATAGVDIIVNDVLHRDEDVELIDITEAMCAPFAPDDTTLKMIRDIIRKPVVPESELDDDF